MAAKSVVLQGADPDRADLRILLIPHAGAGAAAGRGFAGSAPADWQTATVRLPGRESRIREAVTDLDGLVADVVRTAGELPGRAPMLVVGVCSGAVVGLEAVRELQRTAPGLVAGFVAAAQWPLNEKPGPDRALLRDAADVPEVLAILQDFGGIPKELEENEEMLAAVLPAIVADIEAVEGHYAEPTPLLDVPLLTIAGETDELCTAERMAGWQEYGDSREVRIPGGHLLLADDSAALAGAIAGHLDHFPAIPTTPKGDRS
ncbi:thioesterase II family protein [Streptomyces canus]|uniref:thioesterase II family protein n=1 Tax=Streptomyces canus TaxID=58343 RepID=UPI0036961784